LGLLIPIAILGAAVAAAHAQTPEAAAAANGGRLYRRHCASCHGPTGKGDGPDAGLFASPPRTLREDFLHKYPIDDLVRRLREGRSLALELDPAALRARSREVEDVVAYLKRLPAIDWDTVGPGWEIYVDRCELCHGPTGTPGVAPPPGVKPPCNLSDPACQRRLHDADLIVAVRHGRKGMPALTPRVTEVEAKHLVAFVRLLSPGFAIYTQYCANCHGDDGRAVRNMGEGIKMPTVDFDRAYFRRTDREQLRRHVWHMVGENKPVMPHFQWQLDEAHARAIIEYLKSGHE
jgi:mono/diheme cytochrome c family protein